MIVDPDFLDHWRTRMLVDALGGDEAAPMYVLRIWGHCQQRRGDSFVMPAAGLKALCRATCDAQALEKALIDAGFIQRDGESLSVPKWAEKNSSLIAAWKNGGTGGRPKKEPSENQNKTQQEPNGNPARTGAEPIRVRGEQEQEQDPPSSGLPVSTPSAEPVYPPTFDGRNAEALNGKAVVPIAAGWELPEQWGNDAEALGWKPPEVLREAERFRQYWVSGKGSGKRRSVKGWRQAWSNWLGRAAQDQR